ncbi:hypothetical protein [uncultured Mediterranean phage]|nr:hypothetical protein [uncultured Mediterranean phage]
MANTKITNHIVDSTVITGQTAVTVADGDYILVADASDSNALKKVLASDLIQSSEEISDIVGAMVSSNTESGITVAYQDSDNTLDFTIGTLNQDTTGTAATVTGAAQSNITSLGTLTTLTVDDITINGSTISDGSHLTIDVGGDIILDADGDSIKFKDGGTEYGKIYGASSNFYFNCTTQDKDIIFVGDDGGSSVTALTLDMSEGGQATFNKGITCDGGLSLFKSTGGSSELPLKVTDSSDNMVFEVQGGGRAHFNYGPVLIGSTTDVMHANMDDLQVGHTSGSKGITIVSGSDSYGTLAFADGSSGNEAYRGFVEYFHDDDQLRLGTSGGEKMRITSNGDLCVGGTNEVHTSADIGPSIHLMSETYGTDVSLHLHPDTGEWSIYAYNGYLAILDHTVNAERWRMNSSGRQSYNGSTANAHATFVGEVGTGFKALAFERTVGGGEVGTIVANTSSTTYNTSSDYRLKENVDYTWDATTRLKQLKPARFNWIVDDTNTLLEGFLAHEVSSIVPEAISGEKDAVDTDGNPDYQGIDHSKLVPLLVKTIQELEARITTLEG